ncbi:MAG: hypothetical protein R3250_06275, partial [Melioribacteraceae bacterium]|nr:hypothetical protein [Melioribacteraceae bacterium]
IGTLASNLMQAPLCKFSGCDSLASEFESISADNSVNQRKELYRIKDNDKLRFRAPEKLNQVIRDIAKKYNFPTIDVQKRLEVNSPKEIIGFNLMLDHLHPNFEGNRLIAEQLFSSMIERGILDSIKDKINSNSKSSLSHPPSFAYSSLDSSFASFKIKYLMDMFPFSPNKTINLAPLYQQNSLLDSLSWNIINGNLTWEEAHLNLANTYFDKNEFEKYVEEINVLIDDKPFDKFPYLEAIKSLESIKQNELTKFILHKYYKVFPDLYAARKLADLYFKQKDHGNAIYFYNKCLNFSNNDPQIYFNLSASYYGVKDLPLAIQTISKCLDLNPNFPNARKIYNSLSEIYKSRK